MTWERLFYKGGRSFVIGAVLEFIGISLYLLTLMAPYIPGIVSASLLEVADVFTVFGIIAWYGSQKNEIGSPGFNAFVVAMTGLLLGMSNFFTPYIWLLHIVGVAMLANTNRRTVHYPTINIWLWFAGLVIALTGGIVGIQILLALGTALASFGRFQLGKSMMNRFIQDSL